MKKLLFGTALIVGVVAPSAALAAERTVTLAVSNMYCAACPHMVKASLEAVPGVATVVVHYKEKTAIVTYDDALTEVKALITATTNAGYPSAPRS